MTPTGRVSQHGILTVAAAPTGPIQCEVSSPTPPASRSLSSPEAHAEAASEAEARRPLRLVSESESTRTRGDSRSEPSGDAAWYQTSTSATERQPGNRGSLSPARGYWQPEAPGARLGREPQGTGSNGSKGTLSLFRVENLFQVETFLPPSRVFFG